MKDATQQIFEIGKLPPQAVDLEEAVLGALMIDKDNLETIAGILKPEDFYKDAHERIFKNIITLHKAGQPVDILTVTHALKKSEELALVGGPYYITQLTNRVASSANAEAHSLIIKQQALRRQVIANATQLIQQGYDETVDVFDLLDGAEAKFAISTDLVTANVSPMRDTIAGAIAEIRKAGENRGIIGIPSGFMALDKLICGFERKKLYVIAARPSIGKTTLLLNILRNACKQKIKVLAFSMEMNKESWGKKLLAVEAGVDYEKLRNGSLSPHEWTAVHDAEKILSQLEFYIEDSSAIPIHRMRSIVRKYKRKYGVELVAADYLQLADAALKGQRNREREISTIAESMKAIAKDFDIPFIALSQLGREVERRTNKKPELSDLRESGAIEQAADCVILIHRPAFYGFTEDETGAPCVNRADLIIPKQREGKTGTVTLAFYGNRSLFANPADGKDDLPF